MFKYILKILGLDYRDGTLSTLYLFYPRNQYSKNQIDHIIILHKEMLLKKVFKKMFKINVATFWLRL